MKNILPTNTGSPARKKSQRDDASTLRKNEDLPDLNDGKCDLNTSPKRPKKELIISKKSQNRKIEIEENNDLDMFSNGPQVEMRTVVK